MSGKKFTKICFLVVLALCLAGCGKPASARRLYQIGKSQHGDCKLVSKTVTDQRTEVVLHDKLQDFDYRIASSMNDIWIDGSSFGSVPGTTDYFESALKQTVTSNVKEELDAACDKPGMYYEILDGMSDDLLLIIYAENAEDGEAAAVQCAKALSEQNKKKRLDGMEIYAVDNTSEEWFHNEHFGSVKLPTGTWRNPQDEKVDYYTEMAQQQTDPKAVFLRTQTGKFSDTGADLHRVVCALGSAYPETMDSPVTFYYFQAEDGSEYYLCDFNYYDPEYRGMAWYTNYKGKK